MAGPATRAGAFGKKIYEEIVYVDESSTPVPV